MLLMPADQGSSRGGKASATVGLVSQPYSQVQCLMHSITTCCLTQGGMCRPSPPRTRQEHQDGALVVLCIDVGQQLFEQIVVDALLVQPRQVASNRSAVGLVVRCLEVWVEWGGEGISSVISPPTLHGGVGTGVTTETVQSPLCPMEELQHERLWIQHDREAAGTIQRCQRARRILLPWLESRLRSLQASSSRVQAEALRSSGLARS